MGVFILWSVMSISYNDQWLFSFSVVGILKFSASLLFISPVFTLKSFLRGSKLIELDLTDLSPANYAASIQQ